MTGTINDTGIVYEYDAMDRLISETDECGRKTEYKRNINGDIVSIRKCGGKDNVCCDEESIIYSYDNNYRLVRKQIGRLGAESYINDDCGRIIKRSLYADKPGYTYERDIAGRITEVKDPYGNITDRYIYDLYGNVICHLHSPKVLKMVAEDEALGKYTAIYPGDKYTYNEAGQMTRKEELLSIGEDGTHLYSLASYVYDDFGRLITEKTYTAPQSDTEVPKGGCHIIKRKYDCRGNMIEITDSTGAEATYEYDKFGRIIKETALQDNENSKITEYVYDRCGRTISRRILEKHTEKGHQKPLFKRKAGNRFLERRREPESTVYKEVLIEEVKYGYDKSGNIIRAVMPDGLILTYTYDESGRKISVTASDAKDSDIKRVNTYKYDEYGFVSERTENGITALYENDAFGNILKEIYADGGIKVYHYNAQGKSIGIISPEENKRSGRDAKGVVTEYDLCGRHIKTVSPNGVILEENTYDSRGDVLEQKKPDGEGVRYGYDADGSMEQFNYDSAGRLISKIHRSGKKVDYRYDVFGNIVMIKGQDDKEVCRYKYGTDGGINIILFNAKGVK